MSYLCEYLRRPLRTEAQARAEILISRVVREKAERRAAWKRKHFGTQADIDARAEIVALFMNGPRHGETISRKEI